MEQPVRDFSDSQPPELDPQGGLASGSQRRGEGHNGSDGHDGNDARFDAESPARRAVPQQYAHIKGWGADLDHANRPGYPMERTPPRLEGVHWDEPEQQPPTVEVLTSIERPGITPVFGTTLPPSGLSGKLRRVAFKYSESDLRHWLILLAADRVNMVEGIGQDLAKGHIPNPFSEMGLKSELRHNRQEAIQKTVVISAVVGLGLLFWLERRSRRRSLPRR